MFCSVLLGMFVFVHCKPGNDSINNSGNIDSATKAKLFIVSGTVVSGIENIEADKVNIISVAEDKDRWVTKKSSQKLAQKKDIEREKYPAKYANNTISTCSRDADEKYHSLLSGGLKIIHRNQYKYEGISIGQQNFFIFFPYQAGEINTRKELINTLEIIKYCCIRPPPIS